jgi:peptidoglycan/xylan/chitin deacetylase (PgdA/CDA1 family)
LLEAQIAALADHAEIVPLTDLRRRLAGKETGRKPLVSLTFDDGYANFRHSVLPVLKRFAVPATLSVVTSFIGSNVPAPFDRWALKNTDRLAPDAWRMASWDELEECVASGLVTIGAHSHSHLKASTCTPEQMREEAHTSAELLRRRLGEPHARIYAYPFGNSLLGHVSEAYEEAVRSAGFTVAVTTDVGLVSSDDDAFRLPRLEAHAQDTPATLIAKSSGAIAPLYLNTWFHKTLAWRSKRTGPGISEGAVLSDAAHGTLERS